MSLQILALAIYNRAGQRREIRFKPGKVNVITGASKTGKSALIDIVDYCLGRNEYAVPSGVIRDTVVWYVLHIRLPNTQAIIGRPAPEGSVTTSAVYLEIGGELALPEYGSLRANSNTTALEQFLTEGVGITANESVPPEGQSRAPLQANISHARFLLYQPQPEAPHEADSHRQSVRRRRKHRPGEVHVDPQDAEDKADGPGMVASQPNGPKPDGLDDTGERLPRGRPVSETGDSGGGAS